MENTIRIISKNDLGSKLLAVITSFQVSEIPKSFADIFDSIPKNENLSYVGELNKNDVMF